MNDVESNFYHVYNRGVEKRNIFQEDGNYFRFIHDLYEFNDTHPAKNNDRLFYKRSNPNERGTTSLMPEIDRLKRDKLVRIVCFCLMPNHFHLILQPIKELGITYFMKKLGTGYAMYFNEKYERVGSLFQGRFKSVLIENDEQFMHLSRYIHLNPIELIEPSWKEEGIKNWQKVKRFLEKYRYSSYLDYIGIKNFPSVINTDFMANYFKGAEDYKKFIKDYLVNDNDILSSGLILE